MAEKMVECKACGKEIASSAKICPHCGKKNTSPGNATVQLIVIAAVVVMLVAFCVPGKSSKSSSSSSSTSAKSSTTAAQAPSVDLRPEAQKKFEDIVAEHSSEFTKATNELQESVARSNRKKALQELGLKSVSDWTGTISSMTTTTEGKAGIIIQLNSNLKMRTWNNALSDIGSDTLIPLESKLFQSLVNLKTGTKVKFSGSLLTSDMDFNREASLTIRSSMRSPEFLVKFTEVTPIE